MDTSPAPASQPRAHASRPRRGRRVALLALGGLLGVAGVAAFLARDFLFLRLGTVREGVLHRSSVLDRERLEEEVEERGIRTIVNLAQACAADETVARERGLGYEWMESSQVPPPEHVDRFLALMDDPRNHPVLLHCEHGSGRTGVMVAIYRMEYEGWSAEDAIAEARRWSHYGSFGEGQDKTEFLKAYKPRRLRGAAGP
jgi:protein-tyrosine phosphatase